MPSFIPRHYDIHAWTLAGARRYLDAKHQLGWRVVNMMPQGRKVVFLFEKVDTPKKPGGNKT
jgi:hypothetical protein